MKEQIRKSFRVHCDFFYSGILLVLSKQDPRGANLLRKIVIKFFLSARVTTIQSASYCPSVNFLVPARFFLFDPIKQQCFPLNYLLTCWNLYHQLPPPGLGINFKCPLISSKLLPDKISQIAKKLPGWERLINS